MRGAPIRRVLIYRLGSLGDTVVALPALHLIAHAFPNAERWMFTNFSISNKAASVSQVLDRTGLIHGYVEYPIGVRDPRSLVRLRNKLRQLGPDTLVYLTEARSLGKTLRDALFFHACGIHRLIGVPYTADMRTCRNLGSGIFEYEGARLARCMRKLGEVRFDDPSAFDLNLSNAEKEAARTALEPVVGKPLLGLSIGAKLAVKDWGDSNWSDLLGRLGGHLKGWGLVMIGAQVEHVRSDTILKHWPGAGVNLCGRLSVRESAAALERCRAFVGHDSGPMHLAAAVGTPCLAIFSTHALPGVWFPYGGKHCILYPFAGNAGRQPVVSEEHGETSINSITVGEVFDAAVNLTKEKPACAA